MNLYIDSKQKDNSWFATMKKKFPDVPNFLVYLKPEQIQRYAKERIFREMVRGQIDYTEYGQYFTDSKFLENLIIAASDELISNSTIRDALVYYDTYNPGIQNVITERAKKENLVFVFNILLNRLTSAKMSGNIGVLTDIQYVLGSYKNII